MSEQVYEVRIRVPGYVGPELRYVEGQVRDVFEKFPYKGHPEHDEVCRRARAWLVHGIAAEITRCTGVPGETRVHVLVVEAGA